MFILAIVVIITCFWVGLAYVLTIVYFAKRIQSQEYYSSEKKLKECDLAKVNGLDLNFLELVTNELVAYDFRWIDDYQVREKDGEYIKLSGQHNAVGACYIRYFINDTCSTLGKIAFYRAYERGEMSNQLEPTASMHYVSLETALKDNKHLHSGLIYKPTENIDVLEELLKGPADECQFYIQEGEIIEMIKKHLNWVEGFKEQEQVDTIVSLNSLQQVLKEWWKRHYAQRNDIYCYKKKKECYQLTLIHSIKLALSYPFFKMHKCLDEIEE